jgi:hypothetical protein
MFTAVQDSYCIVLLAVLINDASVCMRHMRFVLDLSHDSTNIQTAIKRAYPCLQPCREAVPSNPAM